MRPGSGVLCSGSIVFDVLVKPVDRADWGTTTFVDTLEYHVGGNGANTSLALGIIGTPVRLLGVIGDDEQANFAMHRLQVAGVDTGCLTKADAPTAATCVLVNEQGDRKFLHRLGSSQFAFAEPPEFTAELIGDMSHYHLASLFVLPNVRRHGPEMLRRARSAGMTTSLDTNWDAQGRWMQDLEPCLPHIDLLFMNEDEARMITGTSDPATAARILLEKGVRTAVMKLSRQGCAIYTGSSEILCPAFEVECRDTTGAGDCFVAGFLSALHRGATLEAAGIYANAVGALSVQQIGAVAGVRPHAEIEAWVRTAKLNLSTAPV